MIGGGARLRRRRSGLAAPASCAGSRGYSLLELVFVVAIGVTLTAVAVPQALGGLDERRTSGAASYLSTRLYRARMEAVMRSTAVAIRFVETSGGFEYAVYMDGNANGVLTPEIRSGVDRRVAPAERLGDQFTGVDFGAVPGLPSIDPGGTPPGTDPIRLGASGLASFSPIGSSSTGTVYIRGRGGAQYAVRIFGDTGKTRILAFDRTAWRWRQR